MNKSTYNVCLFDEHLSLTLLDIYIDKIKVISY